MRVLVHASGGDTGGQGYRIEEAFAGDPDWHVEAHNASRSSLGYPEHHALPMGERAAEVKRQYDAADVVHLRNSLMTWQQLDHGRHKPIVLHHHGTMFRQGHGRLAQQARSVGALQVASTLDLTLLEPDVAWLPSPYSVDELAAMRTPVDDGRIRIAHFPTSMAEKSTRAFMSAVARLPDVIVLGNVRNGRVVHMPWQNVMRMKASADVLYDQVSRGYGNNSVEAWAMGIPVIAGTRDPNVRALMQDRFRVLPYMDATEDSLYDALRAMVESPALRTEYGTMGMAHARRWHDYSVVREQLKGLWSSAEATRDWPAIVSSPRWLARQQTRRRVAA